MLRVSVNGKSNGEKPPSKFIVLDLNQTMPIASKPSNSSEPQHQVPPGAVYVNKQKSAVVVPTKPTTIVSGKTPIAHEYRELFNALFKIKDNELIGRVLAAITKTSTNPSQATPPEYVCAKCLGPINRTVKNNVATETDAFINVRSQACQTNNTIKGLDADDKIKRKRGPYAVNQTNAHPEREEKPIANIGATQKVCLKSYIFVNSLFDIVT